MRLKRYQKCFVSRDNRPVLEEAVFGCPPMMGTRAKHLELICCNALYSEMKI
jgi:hypothetical protein